MTFGDLHIVDDDMNELPVGQPGTIWFKTATPFEYHNDADRTREATSPDGSMTTVNDVGYIDDGGHLYLTDRKTFMIISGGVNIYPQEMENLLVTHPLVAAAAHRGTARILSSARRASEGAAFDRLRGRAAAAADREALQEGVARPVLVRRVEPSHLMADSRSSVPT